MHLSHSLFSLFDQMIWRWGWKAQSRVEREYISFCRVDLMRIENSNKFSSLQLFVRYLNGSTINQIEFNQKQKLTHASKKHKLSLFSLFCL